MTSNCTTSYELDNVDTSDIDTIRTDHGALPGKYYLGKDGTNFNFRVTWNITCGTVDCKEPSECKGPAISGPHAHSVPLAELTTQELARKVEACGPFESPRVHYRTNPEQPAIMANRAKAYEVLSNYFGKKEVRGELVDRLKHRPGASQGTYLPRGTYSGLENAKLMPTANVCHCCNARFEVIT